MNTAQRLEDLYELFIAGGISAADYREQEMKIFDEEKIKSRLMQIRGFSEETAKMVQALASVSEERLIEIEEDFEPLINNFQD